MLNTTRTGLFKSLPRLGGGALSASSSPFLYSTRYRQTVCFFGKISSKSICLQIFRLIRHHYDVITATRLRNGARAEIFRFSAPNSIFHSETTLCTKHLALLSLWRIGQDKIFHTKTIGMWRHYDVIPLAWKFKLGKKTSFFFHFQNFFLCFYWCVTS